MHDTLRCTPARCGTKACLVVPLAMAWLLKRAASSPVALARSIAHRQAQLGGPRSPTSAAPWLPFDDEVDERDDADTLAPEALGAPGLSNRRSRATAHGRARDRRPGCMPGVAQGPRHLRVGSDGPENRPSSSRNTATRSTHCCPCFDGLARRCAARRPFTRRPGAMPSRLQERESAAYSWRPTSPGRVSTCRPRRGWSSRWSCRGRRRGSSSGSAVSTGSVRHGPSERRAWWDRATPNARW